LTFILVIEKNNRVTVIKERKKELSAKAVAYYCIESLLLMWNCGLEIKVKDELCPLT